LESEAAACALMSGLGYALGLWHRNCKFPPGRYGCSQFHFFATKFTQNETSQPKILYL